MTQSSSLPTQAAIVIVGAMLATGLTVGGQAKFFGTFAVLLAAVNVFGGLLYEGNVKLEGSDYAEILDSQP